MCVCVFIYVFVSGTVQVGPNCEKGAWASWASAQRPLGPAGPKEWGIYRQTQKQNFSGKEEKAQQALQRGIQPPVKNQGEIMKR